MLGACSLPVRAACVVYCAICSRLQWGHNQCTHPPVPTHVLTGEGCSGAVPEVGSPATVHGTTGWFSLPDGMRWCCRTYRASPRIQVP